MRQLVNIAFGSIDIKGEERYRVRVLHYSVGIGDIPIISYIAEERIHMIGEYM